MKKLKTFESYLSDKMISVKEKFNKLKKIIDFIEKYKLKYFIISTETPNGDYLFEEIHKENGNYFLEYESYENKKTTNHNTEITELTKSVVDKLLFVCENEQRFTVEFHLSYVSDIDVIINILKAHKEPIEFTEWIFGMLIENDLQEYSNSYKFQNLLFSTHPEAFNIFMNECIESQKNSQNKDWEPLKIAPGIEKKFKNLFDGYEVYLNAKKYNL